MVKHAPVYSLGDMVIHRFYGVGQIDSIETKPINGVEVECFKVKTDNSVYWFPTDSLDNPRFHRLASQELIQEAIEILQSDPNDFGNDPVQWKERIDDVQSEGDFLAISSLIRDLSAMKTKKKLNRIQDQALNNLEDRLLREWAASLEVDVRSIRPMLHGYLNKRNTDIQEAA